MTTLLSKKEVQSVIEDLGLHPVAIEMGEVTIQEEVSGKMLDTLRNTLLENDLVLVTDKEIDLIESVKSVIVGMIYSDELPEMKYSEFISQKLNVNYTCISKLFSKVKNTTIEHYIISLRIERVKALLMYNEFTLSEIAWKLHYSSTAHLSAQFKKVTGQTPSDFKKTKFKELRPIESM